MAAKPRKSGNSRAAAASDGFAGVTIRHYCQGIGDSHLLKFRKADRSSYWVLIDCGIHTAVSGGSAKIREIAADIVAVTKGHVDLLVVTHEHWDHVSGFLSAAEQFEGLKVDRVWMGWTEDPRDPDAIAFDKYKGAALSALQKAGQALQSLDGKKASTLFGGLDALSGFNFGAKGERVRSARNAARDLARDGVDYLEPGDDPLGLPDVPNIRVYVLGPPRDKKLLGLTIRKSEMYGFGQEQLRGYGFATAPALEEACFDHGYDPSSPFSAEMGADLDRVADLRGRDDSAVEDEVDGKTLELLKNHYWGPAADEEGGASSALKRRRIDGDWLMAAADLAMQLDSRTNNTSLVLAFEFVDTGRVMLFPGDAQVGSWLSWQELKWQIGDDTEVTGPDLLARTVYYKVSHHCSENATLKAKGLEQMVHPDFSAFIPTNEEDAHKVGWSLIPFGEILDALAERAGDRVIRADDHWVGLRRPGKEKPKPSGALKRIDHSPGFWVEVDVA